jgi:hypothetical protein
MNLRHSLLVFLMALALIQLACGGGSTPQPVTGGTGGGGTGGGGTGGGGTGGGGTGGGGGSSQFAHVFLIVEENHSYAQVIGNTNMPYLNSLATKYGLATQYFADAHPSLPNYFELTLGEGTSITGTQGDNYPGPVSQDNVVRALTGAGKTWKFYGESLPQNGYLGGDSGAYVRRHNPFSYLSDVQNSTTQANNMVQFSQFASDLAATTFANYNFIVPDLTNDAHDCPVNTPSCTDDQKLANADAWLKTNIDPLLNSTVLQNSLVIITFDEGDFADVRNLGGQVATVIIAPTAKSGYQSTTSYEHASTLRLMLKSLGVSDLPGASNSAPDMTEFFK